MYEFYLILNADKLQDIFFQRRTQRLINREDLDRLGELQLQDDVFVVFLVYAIGFDYWVRLDQTFEQNLLILDDVYGLLVIL